MLPGQPVRCDSMLFCLNYEQHESASFSIHRTFSILVVRRLSEPALPCFFVATAWRGQRGSIQKFRIRIRQESTGAFILCADVDVPFGPTGRGRSAMAIENLIFPAYGDYVFEVVVDGVVANSEVLSVVPHV